MVADGHVSDVTVLKCCRSVCRDAAHRAGLSATAELLVIQYRRVTHTHAHTHTERDMMMANTRAAHH